MRRHPTFAIGFSCAIALAYSGCGTDSGGGPGAGGTGGGSAAGGAGGTGASGTGATAGQGTGGGIIIDSGTGGGGGGINPDAGCTSATEQGTLKEANLLFVIDRSGSMNCNLPTDGQTTAECETQPLPKDPSKPTKWQLTRDALKQAFGDLQTSGNINAGLTMFPVDGSDCSVQQVPNILLGKLDGTQKTSLDNFLDTVNPKGSTPLAGATILAYAYLLDQLKQAKLPGNTFVVLLTDGFETCKPAEVPKLLATDVPTAYQSLGIRTFVIGVPGSEDGRALLSQIAFEGGTPKSPTCTHNPIPNDVGDCHFDMTKSTNFGQDLKTTLAAISGTVGSCELDVPAPPPGKKIDFGKVGVKVGGTEITKDDSKPCDQGADGWQYAQNNTKILLCGSACAAAKSGGKIEVVLGCLTDVR